MQTRSRGQMWVSGVLVMLAVLITCGQDKAAAHHAPESSCFQGRDLDLIGHTWFNPAREYRYRIIRNSFPAEFDTAREQARVMLQIRRGERAWRQGRTDCHYGRHSGFLTEYDGDSGSTAADHLDDINTIDFAPGAQCPPVGGVLGCATVRFQTTGTRDVKAGTMRIPAEADVRLDRARSWHLGPPEPGSGNRCHFEYDLRSVATHEFGHVVGLDDLYNRQGGPDNSFQTMFHSTDFCRFRQHQLGRSDWVGLRDLYSWP